MKNYTDKILSATTGLPTPGASVTVLLAGSATKATLFAVDNPAADPISNPVSAASNGAFSFYVSDGIYDLVVYRGLQTTTLPHVEIVDDIEQNRRLEAVENGEPGAIGSLRADLALGTGAAIVRSQLPNSALPYDLREFAGQFISLKQFGLPCGNGVKVEDSAAFAAAFAWQYANRRSVPANGGTIYPFASIFVPPGDYKVTGGFGATFEGIAMWCFPHSVTITIDEDQYFYETALRQDFTHIENFRFIGGKGIIHHTFSKLTDTNPNPAQRGNNVTLYHHTFRGNTCLGYTVCALSSNAEDFPYWLVESNQFFGKTGSTTKGVVLHGLLDAGRIIGNSFNNNSIHLQLGAIKSGSTYVEHNDFLSFDADRTDFDLWLIPNDVVGNFATNTGGGMMLRANKFGNEGITSAAKKAPRILIAAATGADGATNVPDLTWKNGVNGANWLSGLSMIGNRFVVASVDGDGVDAPLCAIYAEKVGGIFYGEDNTIEGGSYRVLFEHFDGGARVATYENTNWRVLLGRASSLSSRTGVSNRPIGIIEDPNGSCPDRYAVTGMIDPTALTLKTATSKADWTLYSGCTVADAVNLDDGTDATEATFPTEAALIALATADITSSAGNVFWLAGAMHRSSNNPATRVTVRIAYFDGVTRDVRLSTIAIPVGTGFYPVAIRFPLPESAQFITAFFSCPEASGGSKRVTFGDFKIARGRSAPVL